MKKLFILISFSIIFSINAFADMTVYFIDVGQGDSEFIVLPNSKTVLIDGGPSSSNSSNLATFLNSKNITTIDYIVLTHPHDDHHKGLQWVFDNCQVNNFYDTKMNNSGATGDETTRAKAASEPGCTIVYPTANDLLVWDSSVTVKVLYACPNATSSSDGTTINQNSIVLKMTYNGESILFAGDIDTNVEATLVSTYGNNLSAKVLKVPHHGSAYGSSTAFLDKVKPTRAYIEVGANNSYGHPDSGTVGRLQTAGAIVYRTDTAGTMSYTISSTTSVDITAPSIPSGLSAVVVSSTVINLTWTASTDNIAIAGYQIRRGGIFLSSTTSISYTDTGLSPSTLYSYIAKAYDGAGNISTQSNTATATTNSAPSAGDTTPPSLPSNLSATVISSCTINLTWITSTDNVGVVGYQIFRNNMFISSSTATSYSDIGLNSSTLYSYTVAAYDSAGNHSSKSTSTSATTNSAPTASSQNVVKPPDPGDFVGSPQINFGGTSSIKKKIKELKKYKDALK
ncbi:MAG: MBL fold metallo-hydrolase [Elusimicrobia bacterium]|nr:MBL fold metallo-hydrolase [Candidatus Liberimonas magnetica]